MCWLQPMPVAELLLHLALFSNFVCPTLRVTPGLKAPLLPPQAAHQDRTYSLCPKPVCAAPAATCKPPIAAMANTSILHQLPGHFKISCHFLHLQQDLLLPLLRMVFSKTPAFSHHGHSLNGRYSCCLSLQTSLWSGSRDLNHIFPPSGTRYWYFFEFLIAWIKQEKTLYWTHTATYAWLPHQRSCVAGAWGPGFRLFATDRKYWSRMDSTWSKGLSLTEPQFF